MTGELAVTQQRVVVELYVRSKWMKANLALEDENLFIEYAHNKHDQTPAPTVLNTSTTNSTKDEINQNQNHETPDTISSQKRTVKIVKPDNTGLGKVHEKKLNFYFSLCFLQESVSKVDEKIECRF